MKTFPYVEDYLEVISGKRDLYSSVLSSSYVFASFTPIINLARYDVNFLDSVTDATLGGTSLTDRQAELAIKLVNKYHKQLAAKGIDIANIGEPRYRKPLRVIDRTKSIMLSDKHMQVKFPYDTKMIGALRDFFKNSQGGGKFDKQEKVWNISLSEYNVNWLLTWGESNNFIIDDQLKSIMQNILAVEAQHYSIELTRVDGRLCILNAPESMLEYLAEKNITFDDADLTRLADIAGVLGVTVSPAVQKELDDQLGADVAVFLTKRNYELSGDLQQLKRVINYANLVKRAVVVYDPSPINSLQFYQDLLGADRVQISGNSQSITLEPGKDLLWTHKSVNCTIPLLISHVGMIVGAEKQIMLQNCEKIIYYDKRLNQ
jgi:hypothetical protein